MFFSFATRNHTFTFTVWRPKRTDHTTLEHAERLKALLAIGFARIFARDVRAFENLVAISEIDSMIAQIASTFAFVIANHKFIVYAKR